MTKKQVTTKKAGQNVTGRWVLAVDPFSDLDLKPAARFIKAVADKAGAKVFGTYVLGPETLNWSGNFSGEWLKRYKPIAMAKAAELSKKLNVDIEVVPMRKPGLAHSVETLVKYAGKIKADFIAVSSHSRSGLERWMLGSFAESVILTSKIPVLSMNPTQKLPTGIDKILVPTDLSAASLKFILKVGAFAQKMNAKVELFYRQPDPLDPMIQQGVYAVGGGWVSVQAYLDESVDEAKKTLQKYADGLGKRGILTDVVTVTAKDNESLVDTIERTAKERGSDTIAVLTQSGSVAATLLGSVARSLVRTSTVPVMIFR